MNTAVVVSGGLAETLQATPLVRSLGAGASGPPVLLCPPDGVDLVRAVGGIGDVVTVAGLGLGRSHRGVWAALRRRRLGAVLLCSGRPAVRLAAFMAAVPQRVGCRGGATDILLTDALECAPGENREVAWLRMATVVGGASEPVGPRYMPPAPILAAAERNLLETGIGDGRLLVAMVPGDGFGPAPIERWSPERYAHLANRLATRHGAGIVLLGDGRDRGAAEAMRVDLAAPTVDLCGRLDLGTAAAVIARCDLLVSADTPLLHVAAAVGTPSVGLFGATDGHRRGAAGSEHRVVQALANGTLGSLERVRVDDVLAAIEGAL